MHIAFLNPQGNFDARGSRLTEHPDFGGQLVYVKETALALEELGCRVDILTRRIQDPEWPEFSAESDGYPGHPGVRILRLPCGPDRFLPKEQLWPHLDEWARRIEEFYRGEGAFPDAFTGHYGDGGLAAALLRERTGIPFTFTSHSLGAQKLDRFIRELGSFRDAAERYRFDKRIPAERTAAARAARIITSTVMERLEQYGHLLYRGAVDPADDSRFAVIPPGVNLALFGHSARAPCEEAVAERIEAMLRRDLPAERRDLPLVICSSRFDAKKNHIALVRAWAASPALRGAANLALSIRGGTNPLRAPSEPLGAGGEVLRRALLEVIETNHLEGCITAFELRSQAELAAAYRHIAERHRGIFALTTFYEPFGLAPLEAMAAGLPAVATRNGGPSESLRDENGEYGVLIDPYDPADIANGLLRLAGDEVEWRRFREAGIRRVRDHYTWDRVGANYLATLRDVLAGRDTGDPSFPVPRWFTDPGAGGCTVEELERVYHASQPDGE